MAKKQPLKNVHVKIDVKPGMFFKQLSFSCWLLIMGSLFTIANFFIFSIFMPTGEMIVILANILLYPIYFHLMFSLAKTIFVSPQKEKDGASKTNKTSN